MRHLIMLCLAVVLCTACSTLTQPPTVAFVVSVPHSATAQDLENKTVALVEVDETGDGGAYCSGVWVGDDTILTANHCVEEEPLGARLSYLVRGDLNAEKDDEIEAARLGVLVARDPSHDLALIRAPLAPLHGVAYVAAQTPFVGQPTQTMGHPLGLWFSYSTGVVSGIRKQQEGEYQDMWWVQTTAPTSPGNSGGGLFDESGELLGICHGYYPRGENLNMYVHAVYLRAFLKAVGR